MGRDLSFALIPERFSKKYTREELVKNLQNFNLEWEDCDCFRNCIEESMWNRIFSFDELKTFIQKRFDEEEFTEVKALCGIIEHMESNTHVVITNA